MRRLLAITITLVFGLTLAAPLFAFDASSGLPECCRRNGTHHCTGGMIDAAGSRTVSTIAPKCPNFPKAIAAPLPFGSAPAAAQRTGIPLFARPTSAPQTEARYRISFARSRQKRGPPVVFL